MTSPRGSETQVAGALFEPYALGDVKLRNRVVMSPMTRARNADTVAGELTARYYGQRASAGLIVSEGTTISPEAQGYIAVPGLWTGAQVAGWSRVTRAVHERGGTMFAQLWHVGRMSHRSLQPGGGAPVSASAVPVAAHPMNTAYVYLEDGAPGRVEPTPPRALATEEVARVVRDFAAAADHARAAGFDGVEVHGANGYLLEQFLHPHTNRRTDRYGGSVAARARFTLEVVDAVAARVGAGRVGIRLSPLSTTFDMPGYAENVATYHHLARALGERGLAYLHLSDNSMGGAPLLSDELLRALKAAFGGTLVLAGGLTQARAAALIEAGVIDLAAFGQLYIANPDLVERFRGGLPLATPDRATYFGGDARGYTDYPVAAPPL